MKPIIAITGNYADGKCTLLEGYYRSVLAAGAVPVVVPPFSDENSLDDLLESIDGLIFSGGGDISSQLLGEEPLPEVGVPNEPRDNQEWPLMRMAVRKQMPVLGICRGVQMMTAALGGKLYQDIYVQAGARIHHEQNTERYETSHNVTIAPDSLLARIFRQAADKASQPTDKASQAADKASQPTDKASQPTDGSDSPEPLVLPVNSFHHQAVRLAAPGFRISAVSPDGIPEAVESTEGKPLLGVQWHPECMILGGNTSMLPLFRWLTGEASAYATTRRFHRQHLSLDTHCDTPMFFHKGIRFSERDPRILVNLPNMIDGHLDAVIMVAYLQQDLPGHYDYAAATRKAEALLDGIEQLAADNPSHIGIARTPAELYKYKKEGKKSIMLGIENGYAIGEDLGLVKHFRQRGVVYMTLCHNGNNALCASARPREEEPTFAHKGLSDFGREVVGEMNRVGMMVDLSHAAEQSFYDALEASHMPIVCSHSSSRALCNHPRNLTDDQLRALAACGGVAQVCLYDGFLRLGGGASIHDAVRHLLHMIDVAGIDHVGIGTDFDGDGGIAGCANASEVMNLTRHLLAEGLSDDDLAKVWGGNFLRVMEQVQRAGENVRP